MNYEMLYIIPAPYTEKDVPSIREKVKKLIKDFGGEILKEENLGLKVLAYQIKKVQQGFYILLCFNLPRSQVQPLSQKLQLRKDVLRFLITKKEESKAKPRKKRTIKAKEEPKVLEEQAKKEVKKTKPKKKKIDLSKIGKEIDKLLELKH